MNTRTIARLVAALCAAPSYAQQPAVTRYAAPVAELGVELASLASLFEQKDGRVLISDSQDDKLLLADFATHKATTLGRNGDGPREYRRVGKIIAAGADTVLIYAARRYLFYTPATGLLDKVETDQRMMMMSPAGSDATGRLYFQGPMMSFIEQRSYDSIPVYRVDRRTMRSDTVAWLRTGEHEEMDKGKQTGKTRSMRLVRNPYRWLDTYGVLDDGTVIVARAKDYAVDVITPDGNRTSSAPNKFARIAVPANERAQNPEFPEAKAPFVYEPSSTDKTSPMGQFWVRRSTASYTDPMEYDVIQRTGKICGHVVMPAKTELAGFSNAWVYTTRTDDDGFVRLQRRAYPACS